MGLPAIVSSRCGAAEVIEAGVSGWVCEPDDAPGLARLLRSAEAGIQSEGMRQAARARAERFGVDDMARRLAELYASL